MFGYIYKTTNLINGKIYVGKKRGEFTSQYKGSGKYLQRALKKYGSDNFIVELLEPCETLQVQNEREIYWIAYYRSLNTPMYNIAHGGDGGDLVTCLPKDEYNKFVEKIALLNKLGAIGNKGKKLSEVHRQKIGESNKGKIRSDSWKKKHGDAVRGKPAWNKGLTIQDFRVRKYARVPGEFHHTEETKKKLSEKLTGRKITYTDPVGRIEHLRTAQKNRIRSEAELHRIKNVAVGRTWVNDGVKSKMIYPEQLQEFLSNGFVRGRISWKKDE